MPEQIFKQVKKVMPHCSNCKEELMGNGSDILPFTCSCGEWEFDYETREFNIKEK